MMHAAKQKRTIGNYSSWKSFPSLCASYIPWSLFILHLSRPTSTNTRSITAQHKSDYLITYIPHKRYQWFSKNSRVIPNSLANCKTPHISLKYKQITTTTTTKACISLCPARADPPNLACIKTQDFCTPGTSCT